MSARAEPAPATARHAGRGHGRLLDAVARHSVLIGISLVFLTPIVFMTLTAVMARQQVLTQRYWPDPLRLGNFATVFTSIPLWRYTANTLLVAVLSSLGVIISSAPAAYAFAKLRWRGRDALFVVVLATMMLPAQVTVIPIYVMFTQDFGWAGSLKPLIVPSFFGDAFSIFLLRQFFRTIPDELSEAARIDGARELQVLLRVVVPLAKPALVTVGMFAFLYSWNDFFTPLLYVGETPANYTLSLGLTEFQSTHGTLWNMTMAASLLFMLPTTVLFFAAQRVFIEGIAITGIKG